MPQMKAPRSGVTVRMYRQGHGDCLLLAFRGGDGNPVYMLIDCGLLPGSEISAPFDDIVKDIKEATGNHLHVVAITHEHSDHVSGFNKGKSTFTNMEIDECWLAWTEDPNNDLANKLRKDHGDKLLGLVAATRQLAASSNSADRRAGDRVRSLLAFEIEEGDALAASIKGITNKKAIKLIKDGARRTRYLRPHKQPRTVPGAPGVRVFVLGPPEDEALLESMDPKGDEEIHLVQRGAEDRALIGAFLRKMGRAFRAEAEGDFDGSEPFGARHRRSKSEAFRGLNKKFFLDLYGRTGSDGPEAWRRIDVDWLRAADSLAIRVNNFLNNTSLVLAIELPNTKRVLLFTGDAQRGNWVSWHKKQWSIRTGTGTRERIEAEDLLARSVFYKVGHHGSHNATLRAGGLDMMARDDFDDEFVAMIPANDRWARSAKGWIHPLPAIKKALASKAHGRVFLARSRSRPRKPSEIGTQEWEPFKRQSKATSLYHEYTVYDE